MISTMKFINKFFLLGACVLLLNISTVAMAQETATGDIASSEIVPKTLAEGIKLRAAERRATLAEVKYREAQSNFQTAELRIKTQELLTFEGEQLIPQVDSEVNVEQQVNAAVSSALSGLRAAQDTAQEVMADINDIKVLFWLKDSKPAKAVLSSVSLGVTSEEINGNGKLGGKVDIKITSKNISASYKGERRVLKQSK